MFSHPELCLANGESGDRLGIGACKEPMQDLMMIILVLINGCISRLALGLKCV